MGKYEFALENYESLLKNDPNNDLENKARIGEKIKELKKMVDKQKE